MRNPHFDDNRVLWNDSYSGEYEPVPYDVQFDDQWRFFLEKRTGFTRHTGVELKDPWIDRLIYALTGEDNFLLKKRYGFFHFIPLLGRFLTGTSAKRLSIGGELHLEPKFPLDFFINKDCLDVGCGAGRWSKTLNALGANVTAIDVSKHGLESTKRIIPDVRKLSIFDIKTAQPSLKHKFDFTLCWGVIMCTHDPLLAFENVASTIKDDGKLYIMVYAPGYHDSDEIIQLRRKYFNSCHSINEKLEFAYNIAGDIKNTINYLDMLNTFYNWVIDENTIMGWAERFGFRKIQFLNKNEPYKCAHHVLLEK